MQLRRLILCLIAGSAAVAAAAPRQAHAQSDPLFVQFSPSSVKGALYRPDSGPEPTVAVIVMHRTGNFLSHPATSELTRRGFLVLAMNPRFDNNEAAVLWESIALDIRSGVEYLRRQPGIAHVLLFGHSGGGPAMSFYQAVAEEGPGYCRGPNKLVECGTDLADLPPADGLILVDAHPGNPVNGIRSLNPAVLDEDDPTLIDPALDPYNPANGYNPNGPSNYPEAFQERYFKAQADRMNRLIDRAREMLVRMESGDHRFPDDDVFLVVRGVGARLMQLDPSIHHATARPQRLLRNDGTVITAIVESVRRASQAPPAANSAFGSGTRLLTVRSFLSANATRATDSMDGIDDCSSNNSTPCAVRQISVPLLVVAAGAHYFIRDNEIHYELAASEDKEYIVIEGATHSFGPCAACATTPGQYSNATRNFYDHVAAWIRTRF
jgi:pimeloyl-ACP methyl ester carboxylesterase